MSEQKNSFLYIGENGKAEWGAPEGYPYKEIGTILDGTFEFIDNRGIYMYQITDENFTIVDGKSYTVIWDGETYQCVATTFSGFFVIGNLGILGAGSVDTGEPFFCSWIKAMVKNLLEQKILPPLIRLPFMKKSFIL